MSIGWNDEDRPLGAFGLTEIPRPAPDRPSQDSQLVVVHAAVRVPDACPESVRSSQAVQRASRTRKSSLASSRGKDALSTMLTATDCTPVARRSGYEGDFPVVECANGEKTRACSVGAVKHVFSRRPKPMAAFGIELFD